MVHTDLGATGTTGTMEKTTNAEFDAVVASETLAIQPRHLIERHRPARGAKSQLSFAPLSGKDGARVDVSEPVD